MIYFTGLLVIPSLLFNQIDKSHEAIVRFLLYASLVGW